MGVTAMTTPEWSLEQRREALERANGVRVSRAIFKARVKRQPMLAVEMLRQPRPAFATMKVHALMLAIPRVGPVSANKMLKLTGASPSKTLEGLTARQRHELAFVLEQRCRGRWPLSHSVE